jgi:hypothetical protein
MNFGLSYVHASDFLDGMRWAGEVGALGGILAKSGAQS